MRRPLHLIVCLLLALASPALAGGLRDENVLTAVPTGFKLGDNINQGQMTMAEYVPARETVDNWSTMITVQIFHGQGGRDPESFASTLGQRWNASCPKGTSVKVVNAYENGYPVAVWSYECPLNPATRKPENMWVKVVAGADALYSVQYADRAPMSPALIRPAMAYLHQVKVCDTRRPDRACPAGM